MCSPLKVRVKERNKKEFSFNSLVDAGAAKNSLSKSFWYNWSRSARMTPVPSGMSTLPPYRVGKHSTPNIFFKFFMSLPWKWICGITVKIDLSDNASIKHETHSFPKLLLDEWLENGKQHVEEIWIVDDMHGFQPQRKGFLNPLQN